MSRVTFQSGTLIKRENANGFVWALRYNKDGQRKSMTLGTDKELPTEAHAKRKAADMIAVINDTKTIYTFGQLVEKYIEDEIDSVRSQTGSSYKSNLKHLKAKWSEVPLDVMLRDIMAIQTWLSDLKSIPTSDKEVKGKLVPGRPARVLSKKTKHSVKALLHRLVNCAMKWGYLPVMENPIALVEVKIKKDIVQPKKRLKVPLNIHQYHRLVGDEDMPEHVRVMCKLAMFLGLRISEVLGLRWDDIDFERKVVTIDRSVVGKEVDDTKSVASRSEMPLCDYLLDVLKLWKESSEPINGWVFGSAATGRPFHRDSLQADHLLPAGLRVGIHGLGWHTFRHTHIALHRQAGTALEVQMMSMRHADIRTTNEYGRDDSSLELKRPANDAVASIILQSGESMES